MTQHSSRSNDETRPPQEPTWRRRIRAVLLLVAHALLLWLAFPGLDNLPPRAFENDAQRARLLEEAGPFWGGIGIRLAEWNRDWRLPSVRALKVLEVPARIGQSWHLYRDGPDRVHRLEVRVDGDVVYRSADPAHAWRQRHLSSRRMRPLMESLARRPSPPNWEGIVRWIGQEAGRDLDARRVDIYALRGPFPGRELSAHRHFVAEAPGWEPQRR